MNCLIYQRMYMYIIRIIQKQININGIPVKIKISYWLFKKKYSNWNFRHFLLDSTFIYKYGTILQSNWKTSILMQGYGFVMPN